MASKQASSVKIVKKKTISSRIALVQDAPALPVILSLSWMELTGKTFGELKCEGVTISNALSTYTTLFYHKGCGGWPRAFHSRSILCSDCNYEIASNPAEHLGSVLIRSEFEPKIHNPTFLY